ncbi:hypothetical protein [Streptomyces canus]|uniref:hypothetical protein n=1 Tax=Streptomyces canus TaxID=58343 RepID=UPI000747CD0F|nr:hypothetical protein [Streptomyces canus]KUN10743.1 hypothetical protein AQI96_23740 [Streptomyces canus]
MEQRIGSSSQPLEGAGFDPAFIPGLTSPVSGEGEEARAEEAVDADADEPTAAAAESEEAVEEEAPDGPVFEASDRRAKFIADHQGIRLSLDDQACEFRWDEIGAVETETPRFGKRFTITVHTPDRRWYPIEIEAESRARFAEWDEQLDAVMDKYFEDETPETKEAEPEESD